MQSTFVKVGQAGKKHAKHRTVFTSSICIKRSKDVCGDMPIYANRLSGRITVMFRIFNWFCIYKQDGCWPSRWKDAGDALESKL